MKKIIILIFLFPYFIKQETNAQSTESLITSFFDFGIGGSWHRNYTGLTNQDLWIVDDGEKLDLSAGIAYKHTGICFTASYENNPFKINTDKTSSRAAQTDLEWTSVGFYTGIYNEERYKDMIVRFKIQGGPILVTFPELETVYDDKKGTFERHNYEQTSTIGLVINADIALGYYLDKNTYLSLFLNQTGGRMHFSVENRYDKYNPDTPLEYGKEMESFQKSWTSTTFGLRLGFSF